MDIPWSRIALNRTHRSMDLDYPDFHETEGAKLTATVNPASAEKLFAGSGHSFAEIVALGKDRKPASALSPRGFPRSEDQGGSHQT